MFDVQCSGCGLPARQHLDPYACGVFAWCDRCRPKEEEPYARPDERDERTDDGGDHARDDGRSEGGEGAREREEAEGQEVELVEASPEAFSQVGDAIGKLQAALEAELAGQEALAVGEGKAGQSGQAFRCKSPQEVLEAFDESLLRHQDDVPKRQEVAEQARRSHASPPDAEGSEGLDVEDSEPREEDGHLGERLRDESDLEVQGGYATFLARKAQLENDGGFAPSWLPPSLFDFQSSLVEWGLRKGRAAIFADCGLGKTPMQLVWAENVVRHTNKPVLILTPLAVSPQTLREAEKFGVNCKRATAGITTPGVYVTNYERLHHLNAEDFAGVVCDESSILKSFDGVIRGQVTEFMRKRPYRLLCTATAAPNDFIELGTSSEALGFLGHMDMLNRFFKNDRNNSSTGRAWGSHGGGAPMWRFRGHAEEPFWRWVCSWARALRRPSDLGFDDARFLLPPLDEREHTVAAQALREGMLFSLPAIGLAEEREERRRTLRERCERAAALVSDSSAPAVLWCHLNDEGDLLESLVPGCIQVSGKDSDDAKEEKLSAFTLGQVRVLVTKPVIGAWGLNWQHCAHMTSFASHSFEQYYQSVRRFWRFGQARRVVVDVVVSDGEHRVLANLQRKAKQADEMFANLTKHVQAALHVDHRRTFNLAEEVPSWL